MPGGGPWPGKPPYSGGRPYGFGAIEVRLCRHCSNEDVKGITHVGMDYTSFPRGPP
jgi:hypothetical protein